MVIPGRHYMNTQKMIQVLLTAIDSGSLTKAGEILSLTEISA